jgi:probable phosphoglycerate mutase
LALFLLVRHGPTATTGKVLYGRMPGLSLTEDGAEAAQRMGEALADVPLAAIYTSPLERARETAAALAAGRRLEPQVHPGLNEIDYGDWTGRTLASLRKLKAWRTVVFQPSRMAFRNGETMLEAQNRAVNTIEELAALHRGRTVAAVAHGDLIKSIVAYYLGLGFDFYQRLVPAPLGLAALELPEQGMPRLLAWNWTPDGASWKPGSRPPATGSGRR